LTNSLPTSDPYADVAEQYARQVIAGEVPAGGWVRKAARRHLDDRARELDPDYPYTFKPKSGGKVCRFIEKLPHTKGQWAAQHELLKLQPWQCFLVVVLFGWLKKSNGKRRFRSAYFEIPRKNGKSILAAGIGLYMLLADNEFGAEVYSGATSEKQAWEVFKPAKLMLTRSPDLCKALGGEVCAKALVRPSNGSKFEPVIGNPGDGPSPSCAIVDEYHEHQTPALYDSMETGMGAREQPLMLVITTAGYNIAGPCHEKHTELCKVLDGVTANDELFGCIFGIDPQDDWADPKSLVKANPNYGVSVDAEFLRSQQRQAMANPVQQNKFKTKHLNVWCSVLAGWMNMQEWTLAADPLLDEDEIGADGDCWIAIDLASKSDMCAEQRLYRRMVNASPHYYLFGRYWLPEAAVEERGPNAAHYAKWIKLGLLTQTDGATVDFEQITEQVVDDCKRINPIEVVFDPFNATQMAQALMVAGVKNVVEFVQQPQNFALPMDELAGALKDGRFHHDGNEITTWCFSNVVARPARKGLFAPVKSKPHQKIDGAVAAIMAVGRASASDRVAEREYQMIFV
jgi:phage terminase large subunit-like protein